MKRTLLGAIGILAFTAVSQPLFAADSETPAGRETAAPAADRTPARQRQARPAQEPTRQTYQTSQQTTQQSWSGSQVGGFGGGNVGGGGFADPVNLCHQGLDLGFGNIPCAGVPYNYSSPHGARASGGGFYSYSIPVLGWAVIGVQGEIVGQRVNSSSTQSNTHNDLSFCSSGSPCGRVTSETYSSNFNIGANGSVLVKFGVPLHIPLLGSQYNTSQTVLIYGLVGPTWARIDGSYTYTGVNYCATPSCGSFSPTTASGALNWSQTKTGIGAGVGAEWAFMPGVNLRLEYRYTSFGSISQDVPLGVGQVLGTSGCTSSTSCVSTAHIDISKLSFQSVRFGVGFSL